MRQWRTPSFENVVRPGTGAAVGQNELSGVPHGRSVENESWPAPTPETWSTHASNSATFALLAYSVTFSQLTVDITTTSPGTRPSVDVSWSHETLVQPMPVTATCTAGSA